MIGIGRLKRRAQFLAVAGSGRKWVAPGLILQVRRQTATEPQTTTGPQAGAAEAIRFGLTASRKVGGAVVRNRARRRLRALAVEILGGHAAPGHDFVLIARSGTLTREFAALKADLTAGLRRFGLWRDGEP
jgi:ribonuclease P protein component